MAADGNNMYTYTNVLTHRVDHDASCTMCAWWRNNDEEADADDDGQQLPVRMITIMMMIMQTMMALMAMAMMGAVLAGVFFRPPSATTALSNCTLRCIRKAYHLSDVCLRIGTVSALKPAPRMQIL